MKFRNVNRRDFIGSLLALFALASCKKILLKNVAPKSGYTDPRVGNPNFDPGIYSTTEIGEELYTPVDLTKKFHGYTDKISYKPGETVSLYLSAPKSGNRPIALTDANGNNVVVINASVNPQTINTPKPWLDGFMYNETATIQLPPDLKSGFYQLPGNIPLICKGNDPAPEMTVVFPSNTFNAYNDWGGKSLYRPDENTTYRATVVSHLRYSPTVPGSYCDGIFPWMAQQQYNAKYIADIDLDNYAEIENSKIVIIVGHSEYWTREARGNIDKFIASGKNVLILSGNTMWWQVRYNLDKKLMICYKNNDLDPLTNTIYSTINWPDSKLGYNVRTSIGADFTGGGYPSNVAEPLNGFIIAQDASPLLKDTGLRKGDLLSLPTIETDGAPVKKMILPGSAEIPVIDNSQLNFNRIELIAYTFALRPNKNPSLGTFVVCKRTPTSGAVVNVASTNWCSPTGIGGIDKLKIQTITKNMIDLSLSGDTLFSNK